MGSNLCSKMRQVQPYEGTIQSEAVNVCYEHVEMDVYTFYNLSMSSGEYDGNTWMLCKRGSK